MLTPALSKLASALCILLTATLQVACRSNEPGLTEVEFWAMGQEGERVKALLSEFERRHPEIRVKVQQIPWSAAHEKLLTAYAGEAMPDVFQLGNTWIPEFAALHALEALDARLARTRDLNREDFFAGIYAANRIDEITRSVPWYVDTRVLFYRKDILAEAGYPEPPADWRTWIVAMERICKLGGGTRYAMLLPMNEWQIPAILGLQAGASLLREGGRYGDFRNADFRRAFSFYLDIFRRGLAPAVAEAQIANLYQEFAAGYVAFYITGPWNLGEFRRRLPATLQDRWATAPLPAPEGTFPGLSLAGGASLGLSSKSRHKDAAWKLIEYLAAPPQQVAFYRLTGNLPARRSAWDHPILAEDAKVRAFRAQIERTATLPQIPEWEHVANKLAEYAEKAVRGEMSEDQALQALDRDVDRILEKRRWLMEKGSGR
ncbi:sugar ABC transporter substrate-binding protein [Methylococcus sp. EFPC2]|uniref:sugar ABC transporter substrate-binding protein n=1 Tax=Methylococcus sp. EFPC2 TaxID=2812648 RepID=UPI00196764F8|nr:sugar ABC transporter substrate-binding protein [Methylococcus sp. EFPC2]QSA98764.1 sugar ABC transporter substrate-binding protein [Methylococcus sp. EFPC2]